ncbi:MFS transporter [Shewanella sp. 202IG2-18]|uniref:MFS transporter n=1 Tax=Parashewanella hymeniacidonis TaxID=2807618 RepID=UPI00195F25DD|nr:MFS transporter [Parashewanella hymeniacidonis]
MTTSNFKVDLHPNNITFKKAFAIVFLPFAAAFILSCLFRTMNAVLVPTLVRLTQASPSELGILNATYFLAYALFQIPLGTLLDNYGAKRIQSLLFLIAGSGLVLSGLSDQIGTIAIGHALLGVGMSGGLMAAFKMIVQWFPSEKIPMLNGIMMTFGGIGILLSATPTEYLVTQFGWQDLNICFGLLAIITALIIYAVVPETKTATVNSNFSDQLNGIATIFKSRYFWTIALITTSVLPSFMAVHGLWIENWLQAVSNKPQSTIDNYLVLMAIAMTVSLLSTGYIAKIAKHYKKPLENILALLVVVYIVIELVIIIAHGRNDWVWWILLSLISQIFNLSYAVLTQHFQKTHSGRANTALNVVVFTSVFLIQYLIGLIVTVSSQYFSVATSYKISFILPVLIQVIFFYLFLFLRKKSTCKNCF